jgi:hypothetical protein
LVELLVPRTIHKHKQKSAFVPSPCLIGILDSLPRPKGGDSNSCRDNSSILANRNRLCCPGLRLTFMSGLNVTLKLVREVHETPNCDARQLRASQSQVVDGVCNRPSGQTPNE